MEIQRTPTLARHTLGANKVYLSEVVPQENQADRQDADWSVMLSNIELER